MELSPEERAYVSRMLLRLMELGIGAVYGDEEEGEEAVPVDCGERLGQCRAVCCTLNFALTKREAEEGLIAHDPKRPFFIKRQEDGYCAHIDRGTLRCLLWPHRPARCRRYDCRTDPHISGDAGAGR